MSVIDNMLLAARNQLGDSLTNLFFNRANYKNQEKKLRSKALEILELLGLDKASGELPTRLSGGQLKLLEIGRALMAEPKMLLLDEPAAGVSVVAAERLFEKLLELNRKFRVTFLIIEHRLELISKFVDKVFVMNRGRILAEGKPEEVFKMDKVIEAYLGEEVSI
jgi:branched-chain amino acid transport system ATP-binding protein